LRVSESLGARKGAPTAALKANMKLLIFDLDGTLIDSLADLADATNHVRARWSLPPLSLEEVRMLVGQGAKRLVERALPGLPEAEVEEGLALFLRYNHDHIADKTVVYPGVPETLRLLQERRFILTIASNKTEELCRQVLATLGVEEFFAAVLGADSVKERKPSPEPLLKLMSDFSTAPAQTAMIGDSINDIAAGVSAGVLTVGCSFGYGDHSELAGADYLVDRIPALLDLPPFT
jgi:phosphoglycolate phosphatase